MRKDMTFESTASPATYLASGTAVVFGLSVNEFAAVAGIVIAVATFVLNWYYKERAAKALEKSLQKEDSVDLFFED